MPEYLNADSTKIHGLSASQCHLGPPRNQRIPLLRSSAYLVPVCVVGNENQNAICIVESESVELAAIVYANVAYRDSHGEPGVPPCQRCIRNGSECVLGGSNRGGRRLRNKSVQETLSPPQRNDRIGSDAANADVYRRSFSTLTPSSSDFDREAHRVIQAQSPSRAAVIENTFASSNLHSTTDALNFLSQAAESVATAAQLSHGQNIQQMNHSGYQPQINQSPDEVFQSQIDRVPEIVHQVQATQFQNGPKPISYHLVTAGLLTIDQVVELIGRFAKLYHPYLPIAPKQSLRPEFLHETAQNEPHLLTAIITVAARDLPGGTDILNVCSTYMFQLVSELAAGKRCDVEAVEALLLLAEWEPQSALSNAKEIGCGEEDLAAWMHVGLALRLGYYLRLDRTSFRNDDEERILHYNRRRLAWAACYVSDRQISVRIGRAFWSRGPGPVPGNKSSFPTLQPLSPTDDDHASIFQATLELTQLFSNVHDVLYSGMGSTVKMMLVGNYVKYIDDFRTAITSWKSVWGTITCAPNLKITLQMSYEYLRLYNSAYAFQATTFRGISNKGKEFVRQDDSGLGVVGALPDARFIYESVDAAKCLLTLVNNFSDPDTSLRHFPMRFLLYCVNSAVFLYKASSLGLLSTQEKPFVHRMISTSISRLRTGSVRPCDFGSRYAQLLELLWTQSSASTNLNPNTNTNPDLNSHPQAEVESSQAQLPVGNINVNGISNPQDEFSWLDLQAVGEFLSSEQENIASGSANLLGSSGGGFDFGCGVGEAQMMALAQTQGRPNAYWDDLGWLDSDMNRFF